MARDICWYTQHYFRDEDGAKFRLKQFHIELLTACANERRERVIVMEPAAFGKSTHVSKHYPLWLVSWDPNLQILLGSKNSDDAADRLGVIKSEMENNEELVSDFGPFVGKEKWRDDEIEVALRSVRVKDPTIAVFGAGSSIMGRRATHVIGDDLVVIENSGPNVDPATLNFRREWFTGIEGDPEMPGCLDYQRVLGQLPTGKDMPQLARAAGYDPNSGLSDDAKFCGYAEVAFGKSLPDPRTYWLTDLARFRAVLPEQERFLVERVTEHQLAILNVEDNAANRWLLDQLGIKALVLSGYRIEGHN